MAKVGRVKKKWGSRGGPQWSRTITRKLRSVPTAALMLFASSSSSGSLTLHLFEPRHKQQRLWFNFHQWNAPWALKWQEDFYNGVLKWLLISAYTRVHTHTLENGRLWLDLHRIPFTFCNVIGFSHKTGRWKSALLMGWALSTLSTWVKVLFTQQMIK